MAQTTMTPSIIEQIARAQREYREYHDVLPDRVLIRPDDVDHLQHDMKDALVPWPPPVSLRAAIKKGEIRFFNMRVEIDPNVERVTAECEEVGKYHGVPVFANKSFDTGGCNAG